MTPGWSKGPQNILLTKRERSWSWWAPPEFMSPPGHGDTREDEQGTKERLHGDNGKCFRQARRAEAMTHGGNPFKPEHPQNVAN